MSEGAIIADIRPTTPLLLCPSAPILSLTMSPARSDPRDDAALVAAINDGDTAAFEALYDRYRDWVYRLAWRFTANREDALDTLQETFAYLLRKRATLTLTARMTTFLYPVVKHTATRLRRRRQREPAAGDLAHPMAVGDVAQHAGGPSLRSKGGFTTADHPVLTINDNPTDSLNDLRTILASLPGDQREVTLMRFVDDMTLPEIAAALDIPLGTAKSRLHHALKNLRESPTLKRYFQE